MHLSPRDFSGLILLAKVTDLPEQTRRELHKELSSEGKRIIKAFRSPNGAKPNVRRAARLLKIAAAQKLPAPPTLDRGWIV